MSKNYRRKDYKSTNNQSKDDYDVRDSFSRVKKYRGNNNYRTDDTFRNDEYYNHQLINDAHENTAYTHSSVDRNDYYNLDSKIDTLINNNNLAHENLRKELESKIQTVQNDAIKNSKNDRKATIKWLIGIAITVVLTVGFILFIPYKMSQKNEKDITIIKTTIEKNITPTIEKNTQAIENINVEIKGYLNDKSNTSAPIQKETKSSPSTK